MYYNLGGCLFLIAAAVLALTILKELWMPLMALAAVFAVFYWGKMIYMLIAGRLLQQTQNTNTDTNFQSGGVFKVCPQCSRKVKAAALTCPYCGKTLN